MPINRLKSVQAELSNGKEVDVEPMTFLGVEYRKEKENLKLSHYYINKMSV